MENTLSDLMQARLDKWRKNTLPVSSADRIAERAKRFPFEDDESDEEKIHRKDIEAWSAQVDSDPRYYRR